MPLSIETTLTAIVVLYLLAMGVPGFLKHEGLMSKRFETIWLVSAGLLLFPTIYLFVFWGYWWDLFVWTAVTEAGIGVALFAGYLVIGKAEHGDAMAYPRLVFTGKMPVGGRRHAATGELLVRPSHEPDLASAAVQEAVDSHSAAHPVTAEIGRLARPGLLKVSESSIVVSTPAEGLDDLVFERGSLSRIDYTRGYLCGYFSFWSGQSRMRIWNDAPAELLSDLKVHGYTVDLLGDTWVRRLEQRLIASLARRSS